MDEEGTEPCYKKEIQNISGGNEKNSSTEQNVLENEESFQSSASISEGGVEGGSEGKVSDEVKDTEAEGEEKRTVEELEETLPLKVQEKRVMVVAAAEDGGSTKGRLGEDGGRTGCFGVRSYLHQFYDAEKTPQVYEDFVEEDDFEYLVDPGKRRARWCCWFRWCTWSGANLLLIGIITLLVGYLTPKRDVVVGFHDHLEILDRWAITFNQRLEFCRVAGLVIFCLGGVVILIALTISACATNNDRRRYERSFTYITTTVADPYKDGGHVVRKIPITEEIKSIQPEGDAGSERKDRGVVVQMPYY